MFKKTWTKFSSENPLKFLDKKVEDMKRNNRLPPKKEALILYRHCVKASKRFFWKRMDGKDWSDIIIKSARSEFEINRDLLDSLEVGRKIVLGNDALMQIDEKVNLNLI